VSDDLIARYTQMSGSLVPSSFDGKPAGDWIKASDYDALQARLTAVEAEREAAIGDVLAERARADAAERDAERWRFMRDQQDPTRLMVRWRSPVTEIWCGIWGDSLELQVDTAIDAARKENPRDCGCSEFEFCIDKPNCKRPPENPHD
jgi:hypothetical protein